MEEYERTLESDPGFDGLAWAFSPGQQFALPHDAYVEAALSAAAFGLAGALVGIGVARLLMTNGRFRRGAGSLRLRLWQWVARRTHRAGQADRGA